MNNFEDIERELDFRKEWFENFKLKTPSYYHIKTYADKLYEIVKNYEAKTEEARMDLIRVERDAYIYCADALGELKSDYEKGLVRYRDKWINYHEKIDGVQKRFLNIVKKDLT